MSLELYLYIRLILASILLIFGVGLTLGYVPKKLRNTVFDSSRRIMGVAIMILPINTIFSITIKFLLHENKWADLIYLTSVYFIAILVAISFMSLLGDNFKLKSLKLARTIISCVLFPIPLAAAIYYGDPTIISIIKKVTSIHLFAIIIYESVTFYLRYQSAIKRVNNYYSNDIIVNITWLHNSARLMLSIGVVIGISSLIPNIPTTILLIIALYRCFVFIYVFYSFIRFVKSFSDMESQNDNPLMELENELNRPYQKQDVTINLGPEVRSIIQKKIDLWIESLGYTNNNVTLQSLSDETSIPRSQLTNFITTAYNSTFKMWITKLRITRAKTLLINNPELSISVIAVNIGFSSTNSFTYAFKQFENVAPNRWRTKHSLL